MASLLIVTAILILSHKSRASPIDTSESSLRACHQFTVPVAATAVNAVYDMPTVDNDIEAISWALTFDKWDATPRPQRVLKNITVSDTFNIGVQLCTPKASSATPNKTDILQIATHGLAYDKRYWDAELDRSTNSWVEASLKAGYSVLTYDRLSNGASDKPDPYTVVQHPVEVEILRGLTLLAQNGSIYNMAQRAAPQIPEFAQLQKPSKIVHVGHSAGSYITSGFLTTYGSLSDGAIITGFIPNKEQTKTRALPFDPQFAAMNSPSRFGEYGSGYVVAGSRSSIQANFFGGNPDTAFTKEMVVYGELIKSTVAVGEWASIEALNFGYSPEFKGPLQYVMGEFDFLQCDGDCNGVYNISMLHEIYPNVPALDVHLQPNTGHGLPLHNNATAGFKASLDFLDKYGL